MWSEGGQIAHLAFAGLRGGGKGGGSQTTSSVNRVELPAWVDQAAQDTWARAQEVADRPYEEYGGQLVAGQTADTRQAFQQIRDMQGATAPAFGAASDAW